MSTKSLQEYEYVWLFSYDHMVVAAFQCFKGVRWKFSTQYTEIHIIEVLNTLLNQLYLYSWKSKGFRYFTITERGKIRHIRSVDITERIIQRTFCDYFLLDILRTKFIYDNGASLQGKGLSFAFNRVDKHLSKAFRKFKGNKFYILVMDIHSFFDSIDHNILYSVMDPLMKDIHIRNLYHQFVDAFGKVGLGMGSQISQLSSLYYLDKFDKWIKIVLRAEFYQRYMDDFYIMSDDLQHLVYLENLIIHKLEDDFHLTVSLKKCIITRVDNTFIFLKGRYTLTETGHIIKAPQPKLMNQYIRHMRKISTEEKVTSVYLYSSFRSWKGNYKTKYNATTWLYKIEIKIRELVMDKIEEELEKKLDRTVFQNFLEFYINYTAIVGEKNLTVEVLEDKKSIKVVPTSPHFKKFVPKIAEGVGLHGYMNGIVTLAEKSQKR